MRSTLGLIAALFVSIFQLDYGVCQFQKYPQYAQPPPLSESRTTKTRSLSGGKATDGNNVTNAFVLDLMRVGLLGGYAVRRLKMFNDRIYLSRYRRSYWFGTRYYAIDNRYFLETRDTCAYRMNETERDNLEYEENGEPILDVIYQCQRYAQYCCGLDCCQHVGKRWSDPSVPNSSYKLANFMNFYLNLFLTSVLCLIGFENIIKIN